MLYTTTVTTPLGTFRLTADDQGIAAIILPGISTVSAEALGDSSTNNVFLDLATQQIKEYCFGVRSKFDLPLSISGTPFQRQVWDIIHRIPFGQTMSYGDIARQLGGTGKARAVGGAANANPLPLVIPCHRVIGSDGTLTGFAGGIDLKKRLLHLEKIF